jgi:hypothetical protein
MDRATLTAQYLELARQRGCGAAELVGDLPDAPDVLLNSFIPGARYLSRPIFETRQGVQSLHADVELVRQLLTSLPARLFDGDMAEFARAAGAEGYQVEAITRSVSSRVSPQARADLFESADGFKLMEFNMGSALGGMENAEICQAMLRHPLLAAFADAHHLEYVDTMHEQVATMRACAGVPAGARPMIAVTDWPTSYHKHLGTYMGKLAVRWRQYGLDAEACHIGELQARGDRIWLRGRPVDIIARMFLLQYLLEPGASDLMDPVLAVAEQGGVTMFTPLDTELFGSKAALAMLSDPANRHLYSPAECAAIDRLLPWTVKVAPGQVTLADGTHVDLFDYAVAHAHDLVLKPALRYGGQDVLPGWQLGTSERQWRDSITGAMGGPYVLQRRIHPVHELFPGSGGAPVPWIVAWGLYTGVNGYAGLIARAVTVESGAAVLNAAVGAHLGCFLIAS